MKNYFPDIPKDYPEVWQSGKGEASTKLDDAIREEHVKKAKEKIGLEKENMLKEEMCSELLRFLPGMKGRPLSMAESRSIYTIVDFVVEKKGLRQPGESKTSAVAIFLENVVGIPTEDIKTRYVIGQEGKGVIGIKHAKLNFNQIGEEWRRLEDEKEMI